MSDYFICIYWTKDKYRAGECMYPDQIKNYTTEKQFEDHLKMLDDMNEYYSQTATCLESFEKIRDEKRMVERLYRNWKRRKNKCEL